jgi:hypothetical protein
MKDIFSLFSDNVPHEILSYSFVHNSYSFCTHDILLYFRRLRAYESHLSTVALSNVESSRTVSQILYDMANAQDFP